MNWRYYDVQELVHCLAPNICISIYLITQYKASLSRHSYALSSNDNAGLGGQLNALWVSLKTTIYVVISTRNNDTITPWKCLVANILRFTDADI